MCCPKVASSTPAGPNWPCSWRRPGTPPTATATRVRRPRTRATPSPIRWPSRSFRIRPRYAGFDAKRSGWHRGALGDQPLVGDHLGRPPQHQGGHHAAGPFVGGHELAGLHAALHHPHLVARLAVADVLDLGVVLVGPE